MYAQSNSVGIRDTRYLQYTHIFSHAFPITLEHSLYSDKMELQHIRLYAGYMHDVKLSTNNYIHFNYAIYYGGLYNGSFQDYGMRIDGEFHFPCLRSVFTATFNPHYDTLLDYSTCYSAGFRFNINNNVSVFAQSTNIPEFRQPQDRIKTGFRIKVYANETRGLIVQPHIAIPWNEPYQKTRLHVDFSYHF